MLVKGTGDGNVQPATSLKVVQKGEKGCLFVDSNDNAMKVAEREKNWKRNRVRKVYRLKQKEKDKAQAQSEKPGPSKRMRPVFYSGPSPHTSQPNKAQAEAEMEDGGDGKQTESNPAHHDQNQQIGPGSSSNLFQENCQNDDVSQNIGMEFSPTQV